MNVMLNRDNPFSVQRKTNTVQVTSQKDQEQYWMHGEKPYIFVTVNEFVEGFQSFHVGKTLNDNLESPFDKSTSHPAALTTREYGASTKELLKMLSSRELLLMKRNSFVYIFKIFQVSTLNVFPFNVVYSVFSYYSCFLFSLLW